MWLETYILFVLIKKYVWCYIFKFSTAAIASHRYNENYTIKKIGCVITYAFDEFVCGGKTLILMWSRSRTKPKLYNNKYYCKWWEISIWCVCGCVILVLLLIFWFLRYHSVNEMNLYGACLVCLVVRLKLRRLFVLSFSFCGLRT